MSIRDPATGEWIPMPSMRPVPMKSFCRGGDLLSTLQDYVRFLQCLVNGEELDGVHILSKKSVESFFTNQLLDGMTLSHLLVEAFDRPANASQRSILDDQDTHSLAWTTEANTSERRYRPQGVGSWAGIFNTYYTIGWELGVVVVSFFQLLPFNDGEAFELYRIFEHLVYDSALQ